MKSVLITGCSKGIGLETALAFGRAGYKVFATMRKPENAVELKRKIEEESLAIIISALDVNSDESVKQGIADIIKSYGAIDVLVNNAGIEIHGAIEELEMADFKLVMETNYFGVLRCIKAVLPDMRKRKAGCIINLSSVGGRVASAPLGPYASSKFALEAISEILAQEVRAFNVKVAIVEPGVIETDMTESITEVGDSIYPHAKRKAIQFGAALKNPIKPSFVAKEIVRISESDSWQLRYPTGPDAEPILQLRASMTDEQWIDYHALNDAEWQAAVGSKYED